MPLFGKKEKGNSGKPSYPCQNMAAYPTQSYGDPTQNYGPGSYPQGHGAGAPPPYSAVAPPYAAQGQPMPGPPSQMPGAPPMYGQPYPQTVVVQGGFDAGARFDGNTKPSVPPPPPGCMLHPAQMAAMQGSNVVVTQKKGDFWTGGSDGGYTLF